MAHRITKATVAVIAALLLLAGVSSAQSAETGKKIPIGSWPAKYGEYFLISISSMKNGNVSMVFRRSRVDENFPAISFRNTYDCALGTVEYLSKGDAFGKHLVEYEKPHLKMEAVGALQSCEHGCSLDGYLAKFACENKPVK